MTIQKINFDKIVKGIKIIIENRMLLMSKDIENKKDSFLSTQEEMNFWVNRGK